MEILYALSICLFQFSPGCGVTHPLSVRGEHALNPLQLCLLQQGIGWNILSSLQLSSPGGNRLPDPRGREVLERPLWAAEGCQDLGGQEEGAGKDDA